MTGKKRQENRQKRISSDDVDIQVLKRYFNGGCSQEEEAHVLLWFNDTDYEKVLYYKVKEHWEDFAEPASANVNSEWILDKIHHKMHLGEWENAQHRSVLRRLYQNFSRIAAVILLPLMFFLGWYAFRGDGSKKGETVYAEIFSPATARTRFELPDGSSGWLNSGSTLKFPTRFDRSNREVTLIGEGYFDIHHDPKNPFVIKAGQNEVHALGTSFNVMAWPEETEVTVTMKSGLTAFYLLGQDQERTRLTELRKGEQLVYNTLEKSCEKSLVNSELFTSWIDGKLIFRNEPLNAVLKTLGRWYNVDFEVDNKEIESYRYRATFQDETLDEVLKLLEKIAPISHEELDRELLSNGILTKRKIRIYLRDKEAENR